MKRHEYWRHIYRGHRYLEHLTPSELLKRLRDILNNIIVLAPDGRLSCLSLAQGAETWMVRFTHVLEEYRLRGQGLPFDAMRQHALPDALIPRHGASRGTTGWAAALPQLPAAAVVKYGRLEYLTPMLDYGELRICPASYYIDESFGPHRADDERVRTIYLPSNGATVQPLGPDGAVLDNSAHIVIEGNIAVQNSVCDYYVWCAGRSLEPRLFVDFEADACLIIHRVDEFLQRLAWAMKQAIACGMPEITSIEFGFDDVMYFDPYFPPRPLEASESISAPWWKQFRYAYQRECRVVVKTLPSPSGALPILSLRLGSISDLAEIVYVGQLDGHYHPGRHAITPV